MGRIMKFFQSVILSCDSPEFLGEVLRKYHYRDEDAETLRETARRIKESIEQSACWNCRIQNTDMNEEDSPGEEVPIEEVPIEEVLIEEAPIVESPREESRFMEVAMTLGKEIDQLQEQYLQTGLLTEGYMVETLASEILLRGYSAFNQWVSEQTDYAVSRYYFLGSSREYPLSMLPDLLDNLKLPVACNQAYCMIPKKSVVFVAALSHNKNTHCQGICVGCSSPDCPNRMTEDNGVRYRLADMTDRPLPYGYTRILG